ncbi:gliding motility-associated C-terminal domain-containing protein [Neolewinella sp.]|uniref:T9SS type B sorting domain-containing protein n=1 Tax=Neolewinella sp. TaxID=2993543 RepID=UPI003B522F36
MRLRFLLSFLALFPLVLSATHNRAGEIIVRAAGCDNASDQLTVCATIITYTETAQTDVDRDSLELFWGDGSSEFIGRTQITPTSTAGIQRNEYTFCHRYSSAGRYVLSFQDVNRVRGVRNIPGSVNIPFSVTTSFSLVNPILNGCNSSPELSQSPIDNACIGSVWTHNPGAFDIDGDSLAFEFTQASFAPGNPIPNYVLPNQVPGSSGDLTIDPRTGQITWDSPSLPGEYNLAFLVKSFRNGQPLDTLVRDMQVFVDDCSNEPPVIELAREEICVVAGELVEFDVIATAPLGDTEQQVSLTATGRPFDLENNPATFLPNETGFQADPVRRTFRWQTSCSDVRDQEYFLVFRALDNGPPRPSGLATLRSVSIKVVAPPPTDLQTTVEEDLVTLTWENPYACQESTQPDFVGFTVWRREGSNNFAPDTCETGLAGRGYTQLTNTEISDVDDNGRYVFEDMDVIRGRTYCYRVVAVLSLRAASTNLRFQNFESIPSEEICVQLDRDIPLLTKVDVVETSSTQGVVDVCWLLPSANSLDTVANSGPYRYVLSRATGQTTDPAAFSSIATFETPFFGGDVDTCYTDSNLDTEGSAYSYRIELFVGGGTEAVGPAQPASTVRLSGDPTDRANALSWTETVPWANLEYEVYRRDPGATDFNQLATVTEMSYRDTGLVNEQEYCYYIRSVGSYNIDDIPSPLLNRSQQLCLTPEDDVAPCAPALAVESACERQVDCSDIDNLFNRLTWEAPREVCGDDDVAGYRIYFTLDSIGDPILVKTIDDPDEVTFNHAPPDGIVGCYTVTAFDIDGNESETSNRVCVENCPIYELPNVFTPNGDGRNDRLEPIAQCFVEQVSLKIFNRWGQLVFETENPGIDWDGTNLNGEALPSGTYYYIGQIFERRFTGIAQSESPVSGYVELITNR